MAKPKLVLVGVRANPVEIYGPYATRVVRDSKFVDWLERRLDARYNVGKVFIHKVTWKKDGGIRFAFMSIDATDAHGEKVIANQVLLRGDFVAILVRITDPEGKCYGLAVTQPRLAFGSYSLCEIPAGGIELKDENVLEALERELWEETGLDLKKAYSLHFLGDVASTPGGSDEVGRYYYCNFSLPFETIRAMDAKAHGLAYEGEHIIMRVVPWNVFCTMCRRDGKAMTALSLYNLWLDGLNQDAYRVKYP